MRVDSAKSRVTAVTTRSDHERRISSARRRCPVACTQTVADPAVRYAGVAGYRATGDRIGGGARVVRSAGGGTARPGNGAVPVDGGADRPVGFRRTGDRRRGECRRGFDGGGRTGGRVFGPVAPVQRTRARAAAGRTG